MSKFVPLLAKHAHQMGRAPDALRYFHGGYGGLRVGERVLPPTKTGAPSSASYGAAGVCRRDRVYVTTDKDAAFAFACLHPSGRGKLYEVEPIGELAPDPDNRSGTSFECEAARVLRVIKIKGKRIRAMRRAAEVAA